MATFMTYYSTGSVRDGTDQHHKKKFQRRVDAMKHAAALSLETDGYVAVLRNGIEIAEFIEGHRVPEARR